MVKEREINENPLEADINILSQKDNFTVPFFFYYPLTLLPLMYANPQILQTSHSRHCEMITLFMRECKETIEHGKPLLLSKGGILLNINLLVYIFCLLTVQIPSAM